MRQIQMFLETEIYYVVLLSSFREGTQPTITRLYKKRSFLKKNSYIKKSNLRKGKGFSSTNMHSYKEVIKKKKSKIHQRSVK